MADLRITKIVCPSCEGTGTFRGLSGVSCMWCRGATRVPVETAHRYASNLWMIAGGGFIAGDHDFEHKVEMEKRAEKIYALTGEMAPWLHGEPSRTSGHNLSAVIVDEVALDKAAREGYAVRCKTHGPRTLERYASDEIMQKQIDDARVIVSAYLAAAVAP